MTELDLFAAAIATPDVAARAALLDRECADKPALRERLEKLLAAHFATHPLLDPTNPGPTQLCPPDGDATTTYDPHATRIPHATRPTAAGERAGAVIGGKYTLVELLGEGGMGAVWRAEQSEPVRREVAVKLIRAERGQSKTILARFEAERQAIAVMDHTNIARLLEAGTTDAGAPYFVMELVRGVPLTDYCDAHRLGIPERLTVFAAVCAAVQHAHQKGVIHRDLKPSNILVEELDGKPVPKVIDFGLAKATTGVPFAEGTMFTEFGGVVGTPLYMAPEQAKTNAVDVDTRADVYALGVILYELLTGTTPLTREAVRKAALEEVLRLVREQEAPSPSSRLSEVRNTERGTRNGNTPHSAFRIPHFQELDWIVLKALAKERDRRYNSPADLAADVEHFLNHEPVAAGPPSGWYKLRKFVRRHRGLVAATGVVVLAVLLGFIGTALGLVEAGKQAESARNEAGLKETARADESAQRRIAEANEREATVAKDVAQAKQKEAETNLAYAKQGNRTLGTVFLNLDPKANYSTVADLRTALRDNLTRSARELEGAAIGDPLEVAAMQNTLGLSLLGLGESKSAIPVLAKARDTFTAKLGADHPDTLRSVNDLAGAYHEAGQLDKAFPLYREAVGRRTAVLGADHPDTLRSLNDLAGCHRAAGQLREAVLLYEEVLTKRSAKLGADHPDTLSSMNNLAVTYRATNRLDEALPLFEQAVKRRTTALGPDHRDTLNSMGNLAECLRAMGQAEKALPLYREALERRTAVLGRDHPDTLVSLNNLAVGYRDAGQLAKSLPLLKEAQDVKAAKLGSDHPSTLLSLSNLAASYREAGQPDKALPLFKDAAERMSAKLGPDHQTTLTTLGYLGKVYAELKQGEKAADTLTRFVAGMRKQAGPDSPAFAGLLGQVGQDLLACGQFAAAEPMLRECLTIREKASPDVWATFNTHSQLGWALLEQKKYTDAEPLLVKGYEGLMAREKTIPPTSAGRIPDALDRLVALYTATDKPNEAKKYRELRAKYPTSKEVLPPPRADK